MRVQLISFLILPFLAAASSEEQLILSGLDGMSETYTPLTSPAPSLADVLTIEPSMSIFYSYARETEMSKLLSNEDSHVTILVPTNKAVMALARKPHQGPAPVEEGVIISEQEFDSQSKKNVQQWVSAHVIPEEISLSSSRTYDTLLKGTSVTFTRLPGESDDPEWTRVRVNDDITIIAVKEASNGVIYLVDGTVKIN